MIPFEELFYLLPPKFQDKQKSVNQLYTYWVNLRTTLKKPLMRKYWAKPNSTNTDPNVTFRSVNESKPSLRKFKKNEGENILKVYAYAA